MAHNRARIPERRRAPCFLEYEIVLPSKERCILALDIFASVWEAKRRIQDVEGILPSQQRLVFAGKCLDDHRNVADYGLQRGSVLYLLVVGGGALPCK
jgi:hypothetical protein